MLNPWFKWLLILGGLVLATAAQVGYLYLTGSYELAQGVSRIGEVAILAWLCYGLWHWNRGPAIKTTAAFAIFAAYIAVLLGTSAVLNRQQAEPGVVGFLVAGITPTVLGFTGVWAMGLVFTLGLWALRMLLSPGHAVIGIARTVVDESIRMKVALIFVSIILLVICFLPFLMNPAERLQYRIQALLSVTLGVTSILLSVMTVLLACGTICGEIKQRQIFMTMTKPVSPAAYLLGKWLGIVSLNALLLLVAMVGVYTAAMMMRQPQFAQSRHDWAAVENQIFVARESVTPRPANGINFADVFNERVEQLRREDPERYGQNLDPKDAEAIRKQIVARWHTIAPMNAEIYVFGNLNRAKELGPTVQLRFKPNMGQPPPDEMVRLAMWVNGRPFMIPPVANDHFHVFDIPVQAIDADGSLEIRIANVTDPNTTQKGSVTFKPNEGLQVLYRVGGFEMNLARTMAMLWLRLAFLATLGLVAGTFLGFPVACLLAMMVYIAAGASDFLMESLRYYAGFSSGVDTTWDKITMFFSLLGKHLDEWKFWDAAKLVIRMIGEFFMMLVPSFSRYNPVPLIAKGLVVSPNLLLDSLLWVGVVWSGVLALIGWLIFRRRELAQVIV